MHELMEHIEAVHIAPVVAAGRKPHANPPGSLMSQLLQWPTFSHLPVVRKGPEHSFPEISHRDSPNQNSPHPMMAPITYPTFHSTPAPPKPSLVIPKPSPVSPPFADPVYESPLEAPPPLRYPFRTPSPSLSESTPPLSPSTSLTPPVSPVLTYSQSYLDVGSDHVSVYDSQKAEGMEVSSEPSSPISSESALDTEADVSPLATVVPSASPKLAARSARHPSRRSKAVRKKVMSVGRKSVDKPGSPPPECSSSDDSQEPEAKVFDDQLTVTEKKFKCPVSSLVVALRQRNAKRFLF
jgi:hypothetical protein